MIKPLLKILVIALSPVLALTACADDSSTEGLKVVVSTNILGDIVGHIVGEDGEVEVLIPPAADPHEFRLSAQQVSSINRADLVVVNGLGLEAGMAAVLDAAGDDGANILEIGPLVDPLPIAGSEVLDPHVWLDPIRMLDAVDLVVTELTAIDSSVDWSSAGAGYKDEITLADWELQAVIGTLPFETRALVTNHDSLGYLAARYGLEVVGVVIPGGSTAGEPGSADLADLVRIIEASGVSTIFAETTQPAVLAEAVAAEIGREVAVVELHTGSLGEPGTDAGSYLGMLRVNAERIVGALGG